MDMDESAEPAITNPEVRLALGYAPAAARGGLATLFALDARLGGIVARAGEATIGLMRLVWWRDALAALDTAPAPAEPLLAACAELPVAGERLAAMTAGWEALLDDPDLGEEAVAIHAAERGARLFGIAGALLGGEDARLAGAGEGWALVDLARHLEAPARTAALLDRARAPLAAANATRWPRVLRMPGQLAVMAARDARGEAAETPGSRGRLLRIARFHMTGR